MNYASLEIHRDPEAGSGSEAEDAEDKVSPLPIRQKKVSTYSSLSIEGVTYTSDTPLIRSKRKIHLHLMVKYSYIQSTSPIQFINVD